MRPASVRMALYTLRATFERRVREYVVVVILVGLLGGLALAAVAGARRTQSSYASYLASTNPSDLDVFAGFANPALGSSVGYDPGTAARLARLPGVRDVQTVVGFAGNIDQVQGLHPHPVAGGKPAVFEGSLDGEYTTQDRATLVAGSWPDPTDAHQVMLNVGAAAEAGLHLGSTVTVSLNSDAQEVLMSSPTGPSNLPPVKVARLTVVGLVTLPQDVDIDDYDSLGSGTILLTPALTRQIAVCCATYSYAFMKLTDGTAHVGAVEAEVSRLHLPTPNVGGFQTHAPALARADRAIKPVSVSLGVFGALAAISLFLVGVQVFGRQLRRHATETAALRALGAGPGARTLDATLGLLGAVALGARPPSWWRWPCRRCSRWVPCVRWSPRRSPQTGPFSGSVSWCSCWCSERPRWRPLRTSILPGSWCGAPDSSAARQPPPGWPRRRGSECPRSPASASPPNRGNSIRCRCARPSWAPPSPWS